MTAWKWELRGICGERYDRRRGQGQIELWSESAARRQYVCTSKQAQGLTNMHEDSSQARTQQQHASTPTPQAGLDHIPSRLS